MRRGVVLQSPWGWIGISETFKGIDGIVLPQRSKRVVESDLRKMRGMPLELRDSTRLRTAYSQLLDYLVGDRKTFDLPVDDSQGTPFQRRVWHVLQQVPYGTLRSYQWIATRVGGRRYARAVGSAVGANPLPIVIPCHRIVGQDASLGGFSGGLPMKRKLLTLEGTLSTLRC